MRIGAKITLNMGIGAARDGLTSLDGGSWLMSQPCCHDPRRGHPAGSARPARVTPGKRTGLVAVVFGTLPLSAGPAAKLPVHWESLEPSDECAVFLAGDIALAPLLGDAGSILTLGGTCRILPAVLTEDGWKEARRQVVETAREFITSIALILADSAGSAEQPLGSALSWLTGEPQRP